MKVSRMESSKNILKNFLKSNYALVMIEKLLRRLEKDKSIDARHWAENNKTSLEQYCNKLNRALWLESLAQFKQAKIRNEDILAKVKLDLGGGGAFPLIYFLCRYKKPDVFVETGVAAGWSSYAALLALEKNKKGVLYSSDFPYFRFEDPEKFIGILVPNELKKNWSLDVRGDRKALPGIVSKCSSIDIFHYDSDKSYAGREFALKSVSAKLSERAIIIMDDIQDNLFFKECVEKLKIENFFVFEFEGKYVGLFEHTNFLRGI